MFPHNNLYSHKDISYNKLCTDNSAHKSIMPKVSQSCSSKYTLPEDKNSFFEYVEVFRLYDQYWTLIIQ